MAAGLVVASAGFGACRPMIYDIDRMASPVQKARFSCQYLLERALAREDEIDADGVLRRRVARFAEPEIAVSEDVVRTVWTGGGIVSRRDGSRHGGGCTIRLRPQGRWVEAVTLDGRDLHAGFGM
jgi:hypothetical protein